MKQPSRLTPARPRDPEEVADEAARELRIKTEPELIPSAAVLCGPLRSFASVSGGR